ncbi:MAG: ECF transporter S component [Clostridiales bacterium]|nr:ECF transporter S component [Clostridiales bacterium]MBR4819619.1 ECF transporter S component [Clostridiales bacterium]MBR5039749.1 ECF transporter S component [Clostridiales bacterium]MBR5058985.1 ECF transporter S component [Clostridiales bacterium]
MSEVTSNLKEQNQTRKKMIYRVALTGVMTALAEVLMMLEIPLPLMPGFLKYDFSDIPALFAGFVCGPVAGVIVEFLKNLLHMPFTNTQYIGEVANFISGSVFVITGAMVFRALRSKRSEAIIYSLISGTVALTLATSIVNYFFCLPLYEKVMGFPLPAIISMCDEANTFVKINSKLDVILMTFVPFNIFKGLSISLVTLLVYIPLSRFFKEDKLETGKGTAEEKAS